MIIGAAQPSNMDLARMGQQCGDHLRGGRAWNYPPTAKLTGDPAQMEVLLDTLLDPATAEAGAI